MSTNDGPSIKLKLLLRNLGLICLILTVMTCYYEYHKYKVYKSINVVVKDTATVEYGSANYDIKKLVKEVEGEIVSVKKDIDTKVLGEQKVVLEVKKENVVKDVSIVVSIVDTVAPNIEIKNEKVTITEGDDYKPLDNIVSVKDEIDGDLEYLANANDESLKYYSLDYGDIKSVGEHEIVVKAVDGSSNTASVKFTLEVEKKKVAPVYYNLSPNASGNDIVSIAYSLVGLPYVAGGVGPNAFDCSGLVQYVYSRVGIFVSRSTSTQINDGLPVRYEDAAPGDILVWGYVDGQPTHSAIYVGNGQMIHATNPNQGVMLSDVNGWTNGSGTHILSTRRIK